MGIWVFRVVDLGQKGGGLGRVESKLAAKDGTSLPAFVRGFSNNKKRKRHLLNQRVEVLLAKDFLTLGLS